MKKDRVAWRILSFTGRCNQVMVSKGEDPR
jgi:hypothetical protein